jgi:mRNA-degrading endonuclease YafQ of YafQ-DinJ toxin-antitoxin module
MRRNEKSEGTNKGGVYELYIKPNLLLLYVSQEDSPIIKLAALGTHAELFGK